MTKIFLCDKVAITYRKKSTTLTGRSISMVYYLIGYKDSEKAVGTY